MSDAVLTVAPQLTVLSVVDGPSVELRIEASPATFLELATVGPQGAAGPAAQGYEHTQSQPASLWTIAHNLGFRPSVSVRTDGGLEVIADIQHLSSNTLTVTLLAPLSGTARLT